MRDQGTRDDGTFVVSRREFYRQAAEWPEMRALAAWGDRIYAAQRENHDPGGEDRSQR